MVPIADAINATLAAEREKARAGGWLSQEALDEYAKVEAEVEQLREQLAAAQAVVRDIQGEAVTLVDAEKFPNSVLHIETPRRIKAKVNAALSGDTAALDAAIAIAKAEAEVAGWHKGFDDAQVDANKQAIAAAQQPLVECLNHLIHSNHGFSPDGCHGCAQAQRLAKI